MPSPAEPAGPAPYVGRFAPSPTGPLHFGSLLAAVASYAQARAHSGSWLLRIEDIDPPREIAGADELIVTALEAYGFAWDGPVIYQSAATARHQALVRQLLQSGEAYRCSCSRRDLANAPVGPLGAIYPGTCRSGCQDAEAAVRLRTDERPIEIVDRLQGRVSQRLESESGDFIIRRRDGLIAYNLAVVVDDADQQVTEVVRGVDLLDSTPRHVHVQRVLGLPTPQFVHIPMAVNAEGQKLSKMTGAPAIDVRRPEPTLLAAFEALRHPPPAELHDAPVAELWAWLLANWDIDRLRAVRTIGAGFGV